jgi:hypothetical protein
MEPGEVSAAQRRVERVADAGAQARASHLLAGVRYARHAPRRCACAMHSPPAFPHARPRCTARARARR